DRPGITWQVPATLARLTLERLEFDEIAKLPDDFDEWIVKAKDRGAPQRDLDLLEARAAIEREQPSDAVAKLEALLAQDDKDLDARVYYVRALMDLRDRDNALAQVKRGLSAVPDSHTGRLYLEWSNIMSRGGKRRP